METYAFAAESVIPFLLFLLLSSHPIQGAVMPLHKQLGVGAHSGTVRQRRGDGDDEAQAESQHMMEAVPEVGGGRQ